MAPIRERPKIRIALAGSESRCYPGGRCLAVTTDEFFRRALIHQSNVHHVYITIGTGRDYYKYYHDSNVVCFTSLLLDYEYPQIKRHIYYVNDLDGCPKCMARAPYGYYFIRSGWGNGWSQRLDVKDDIRICASSLSSCARCLAQKNCVECRPEREWGVEL